MEKEGAEKAITELDNSVTSEEQGSLAEQNVNNNGEKVDSVTETGKTKAPVTTEKPEEPVAEPATAAEPVIATEPTEDQPATVVVEASDEGKEAVTTATEDDTGEQPDGPPVATGAGQAVEDKSGASATAKEPGKDTPAEEADHANKAIADLESKRVGEEDHDEFAGTDFTTYNREQLVEVVKKLGKDENPFRADNILQQIAPIFNKLREEERQQALQKFIAEGGAEKMPTISSSRIKRPENTKNRTRNVSKTWFWPRRYWKNYVILLIRKSQAVVLVSSRKFSSGGKTLAMCHPSIHAPCGPATMPLFTAFMISGASTLN